MCSTLEGDAETGALLNVFGGKITTYRRLAEEALEKIESVFGKAWHSLDGRLDAAGRRFSAWTDSMRGRVSCDARTEYRAATSAAWPAPMAPAPSILAGAIWAAVFGADLGAREVDFLVEKEWARSAEICSGGARKLGLRFSADETRLWPPLKACSDLDSFRGETWRTSFWRSTRAPHRRAPSCSTIPIACRGVGQQEFTQHFPRVRLGRA